MQNGDGLQHKSREFEVDDLVSAVAEGRLALPEFQRDFVWDPGKVVELLESVSNGWPIGSLLILEGPQPFEVKPIKGGPDVDESKVDLFLLDGQQRVTSLFHALTDTSDVIYFVNFANETDDPDLQFQWARREAGLPSPSAFKVHDLIDDDAFEVALDGLTLSDRRNVKQRRLDVLGSLYSRGYQVPATVMDEDIELEALTRIFETLNRTAVKLNAFDLMVAVLYSDKFNLRQEWNVARAQHEILNEFEVDGLEILKLVALFDVFDQNAPVFSRRRKVQGIRQRDVLNLPAETVGRHWTEAIKWYSQALEEMKHSFGVYDAASIPSDAMTLTLAYLVSDHLAPTDIRAWYWRSIAAQSYSQGANTRVLLDVRRMTQSTHDDPGSYIVEEFQRNLLPSLGDSSRRNRILRLGLRGMYRHTASINLFTRGAVFETVSELSLHEFAEGRIKVGSDAPVVDLMWYSKSDGPRLRKATQYQNPFEELSDARDSLASQDLLLNLSVRERRNHRTQAVYRKLSTLGRVS